MTCILGNVAVNLYRWVLASHENVLQNFKRIDLVNDFQFALFTYFRMKPNVVVQWLYVRKYTP